jgi:Family of unknown function (DUF6152)
MTRGFVRCIQVNPYEGDTMTRSVRAHSAARFTMILVAIAFGWSLEGLAHHSTTYFSKEQKDFVKIQGKVVRWEFRSPHSLIYLETKGADGKLVTWRFESTPAAWLIREGWKKESLAVGDEITAEGFPIPGQPYAWLGKVVKQDGTRLLPQRSSATPDWWKP